MSPPLYRTQCEKCTSFYQSYANAIENVIFFDEMPCIFFLPEIKTAEKFEYTYFFLKINSAYIGL